MRFSAILLFFCALPIASFAQEELPAEINALYNKYGGFEFAVTKADKRRIGALRVQRLET